jgi:hypothetical protein
MNWTKFSERHPCKNGVYWIAVTPSPQTPHAGSWDIFPDYQVKIGSDGSARGEHGCYAESDGCWYGPVELPFKLPALAPALNGKIVTDSEVGS